MYRELDTVMGRRQDRGLSLSKSESQICFLVLLLLMLVIFGAATTAAAILSVSPFFLRKYVSRCWPSRKWTNNRLCSSFLQKNEKETKQTFFDNTKKRKRQETEKEKGTTTTASSIKFPEDKETHNWQCVYHQSLSTLYDSQPARPPAAAPS